MSDCPAFCIPSALAGCWHRPLLAMGASILEMESADEPCDVPPRPTSAWGYSIQFGGVVTLIDLARAYPPNATELAYRAFLLGQSVLQPFPHRHLGRRRCWLAQWNLQRLVARVLVGSGAVELGSGTPGRSVLSVTPGWVQETLGALAERAEQCEIVPAELSALERHERGLAMDELAIFTRRAGMVRLFAGQAVVPQSGRPSWYAALDCRSRLGRSETSRTLANDLEDQLLAHGAIRLQAGSHHPVLLA